MSLNCLDGMVFRKWYKLDLEMPALATANIFITLHAADVIMGRIIDLMLQVLVLIKSKHGSDSER
jgi:hypothetical protein